jgi:hypothetical protein
LAGFATFAGLSDERGAAFADVGARTGFAAVADVAAFAAGRAVALAFAFAFGGADGRVAGCDDGDFLRVDMGRVVARAADFRKVESGASRFVAGAHDRRRPLAGAPASR